MKINEVAKLGLGIILVLLNWIFFERSSKKILKTGAVKDTFESVGWNVIAGVGDIRLSFL